MNWHNVVVQLQLEAKLAYEQSQHLVDPDRLPDVIGAQIKSAQGDILRGIAAALIKGLNPKD
jgi:hypothetical protein